MTQIRRSGFTIVVAIGVTLMGSACDSEKSSNPLSPQIAGPLAGVTITAPAQIQPTSGQLIPVSAQPVSLRFASASSNSVRPFSHEIQVATDAAFTQLLVEQTDIQPTAEGQIAYQIDQTLDPEQVYHWRARALDGANTGPYTATATFEVYTPVAIEAPTVIGPTGGQPLPTTDPNLAVRNAVITGPADTIRYRFELSTQPSYENPDAVLTVDEDASGTTAVAPGALPFDQMFYWRARASAQSRIGEVVGPWTASASFRTPPAPVVIGVPTPASPINGVTTLSRRPPLTVVNGPVSGPAGLVIYRFEVDEDPSFGSPATVLDAPRSDSGTTAASVISDLAPGQDYFWRVRASNGEITTSWSAPAHFRTPAPAPPPAPAPAPPAPPPPGPGPGPGPGPRTPDPPPGGQLPLPYEEQLIIAVANANPGALANSCVHEGGTWTFMDLAVEALRGRDTRWGYNCKRGDCNDPSIDVVSYFWGVGSGDQSIDVYLVDIISAVCPAGNAGPSWTDVTQATINAGTTGGFIYPRP